MKGSSDTTHPPSPPRGLNPQVETHCPLYKQLTMFVWAIEADKQHFYRSLEFGGWWAHGAYRSSPQLKESLETTGSTHSHKLLLRELSAYLVWLCVGFKPTPLRFHLVSLLLILFCNRGLQQDTGVSTCLCQTLWLLPILSLSVALKTLNKPYV